MEERCAASAFVAVMVGSPARMASSQFFQWSSDVLSGVLGSFIGSRSAILDAMSGFILPPVDEDGSLGVTALPRMQ